MMLNDNHVTILPKALDEFSFNRVILRGPHGSVMHKTVHDDLRGLDFISTQAFICYVIGGRERFYDKDGEVITLCAGDLIAIPKDVRLQSDFASQDGPLQAILIFYSDKFLRELTSQHPNSASQTAPKAERISAHPSLTAFMENMVQIYEPLSVNDDLVRAKMSELMLLLDTLHDGDLLAALHEPEPAGQRGVRTIMRLYETQNLSSGELAALSGRSIASFNRDFRRIYGTSYTQWNIGRRLEKSCALLEHTDQSVTQIALEIGYESVSYFIEQFHKAQGKPPLQYRKDKRA